VYRRVALSPVVRIRPAEPADVELIFSLIVELAEYEHAPEQVTGTPEQLAAALFGEQPSAEAVIAELDGEPVGFALFHGTFSTWECRPGLWLEDLYVPPEHRRGGIGRALLAHVAAIAVERGCARLEWAALDWNEPALGFYRKLGAKRLDEWLVHRLDGQLLLAAAAESASPQRSAR
jgi:GNAT superfamily N-acetyltransferase